MNLEYSDRKHLMAGCPNCRMQELVLLTTKIKNHDLLACKSCNLAIFVNDLKKQLFVE